MTINKLLFTFISFIAVTIAAIADNGINSPYSRYGIGVLSDQSLSVNRQMGGLGYAGFGGAAGAALPQGEFFPLPGMNGP